MVRIVRRQRRENGVRKAESLSASRSWGTGAK
jgi:hypothetical protein